MKLPKGAIKPRPAVQQMAPYSPPTGGRAGKLRLETKQYVIQDYDIVNFRFNK